MKKILLAALTLGAGRRRKLDAAHAIGGSANGTAIHVVSTRCSGLSMGTQSARRAGVVSLAEYAR